MIFGTTLNIFSVIGFIMLMGLVTKNAILLVDFTNQGIREGKDRYTAILDAGQVRLRPILMTTAAMIFGMLPLALALGRRLASSNRPMAHAVIGGIITSTALTLVVVPVLFTYFDTLGRKAHGMAHEGASGTGRAARGGRRLSGTVGFGRCRIRWAWRARPRPARSRRAIARWRNAAAPVARRVTRSMRGWSTRAWHSPRSWLTSGTTRPRSKPR